MSHIKMVTEFSVTTEPAAGSLKLAVTEPVAGFLAMWCYESTGTAHRTLMLAVTKPPTGTLVGSQCSLQSCHHASVTES